MGEAESVTTTTYDSSQHPIDKGRLDRDARVIVRTLSEAGFHAYIVGGAVRDLWLGRTPKDYDLGTTALTEEIRRLFRWSRTIGRRFPIVHVYRKPRKVFEVSTFRALGPDVYGEVVAGTPAEDAMRRDLTINGLMYDVSRDEVLDFVGGVEDLEAKRIRVIGDPVERFAEDPVRMVRCYRHANRVGFAMGEEIYAAEKTCCRLLREVSHGRLRLEKEKDFLGEMSSGIMKAYRDQPFGEALDPKLSAVLRQVPEEGFVRYDEMAALLRTSNGWEDSKEILRLTMLLALAIPEAVAPPGEVGKLRMDHVESLVEPWLLSLEVPRWKRPLALQALYGQGQIDQQIGQGFGKRLQSKTWFRVALYLARIRYQLVSDHEASDLLGRQIRRLEAQDASLDSQRQPRRRRTNRGKGAASRNKKS